MNIQFKQGSSLFPVQIDKKQKFIITVKKQEKPKKSQKNTPAFVVVSKGSGKGSIRGLIKRLLAKVSELSDSDMDVKLKAMMISQIYDIITQLENLLRKIDEAERDKVLKGNDENNENSEKNKKKRRSGDMVVVMGYMLGDDQNIHNNLGIDFTV